MDQLGKRDLIGVEVILELFTEESLNLIVDESDTSSKWLVYISKSFVRRIKDTFGDLDRCGDVSAHDGFNSL